MSALAIITSLILHARNFVSYAHCICIMFYTDLLIFILIEMLKNRTHITCITLSEFEEVVEFLLSKYCCNDKSSSVMIGYLSIIPMVMSILS